MFSERARCRAGSYIGQGLEPPAYGPRQPRISQLQAFEPYLRQRLAAFPQLSGRRLHRELRDLGYGDTILTDLLREIRPCAAPPFEVRFETLRSSTPLARQDLARLNPVSETGEFSTGTSGGYSNYSAGTHSWLPWEKNLSEMRRRLNVYRQNTRRDFGKLTADLNQETLARREEDKAIRMKLEEAGVGGLDISMMGAV